MWINKLIPSYPRDIHRFASNHWSQARKLVFTALMGTLAAIFQSAGGLLPGIGYFISPFATVPILLAILISFQSGVFSYLLAIYLLVLIEPTELFIFPFTTGLLGFGLGWTLRTLNRRWGITFVNGFILLVGILIPLYVLRFPVFGPTLASPFNLTVLTLIFVFSLFYSWLWMELGLFLLRKIKMVLGLESS